MYINLRRQISVNNNNNNNNNNRQMSLNDDGNMVSIICTDVVILLHRYDQT